MQYFDQELLKKVLPIKRAAYSDRTAYLMAEISRLVYENLPNEVSIIDLVHEIKENIKKDSDDNALKQLIERAISNESNDDVMKSALSSINLSLEKPFSVGGTEAILVKIAPDETFDGMLILAFRGTQLSARDIISDIKANLTPAPDGGRIHSGFLEAYQKVESDIKATLNDEKYEKLPLYITGHSLGGALALVATRYLGGDSTGATYTFGGPRVADDKFYEAIKTPVYRVVHNADVVPRLPFGAGLSIFLTILRLFPGTDWISEWLRKNIMGYTHFGNLVFLTSNKEGEVVVKKSPNIFSLYASVIGRIIISKGSASINDHKMNEYSKKLLLYAKQRNKWIV